MKKPFQKSPPPPSYGDGHRLTRAMAVLPVSEQERFLAGYQSHMEAPRYVSVQRRGATILLALAGSAEVESYDFATVGNAQRCLAALTDCFRAYRAPVKVLMPSAVP